MTDHITPSGQIIPETPFGSVLTQLAADTRFNTFLEIGPWNGRGSTLCFAKSLVNRTDSAKLYTIEANKIRYNETLNVWNRFRFVNVIYGRVADKIMERQEIINHPLFNAIKDHFILHYDSERSDFFSAPLISELPNVDVILIDGGEFTGYYDWLSLQKLNPKIVCLDDTRTMKTSKILAEMQEKNLWKLFSSGTDRNGWAVLEHV